MKMNKLALAVSSVMVAGQAAALDLASDPVQYELIISGATAANKQVNTYFADICKDGTQTNYVDASDSDAAVATFCVVEAGSIFAVDTNVLFHKENGGSSKGVAPIFNATTVEILDKTTCAQTVAPSLPNNSGEGVCADAKVSQTAQIGVSDVEPELFTIPDNGSRVLDPNASVTVQPVNAQTFGIVVSPGLRDALQTAQGLTAGSDEVAQMPSLSSDMIANLFRGNVDNWGVLKGLGGASITAGAGLVSEKVNTCVRTPGSGTQAQFNAFYMSNACAYRGAGNGAFVGFPTLQDSDGTENNYERKGVDLGGGFFFEFDGPHVHWNKGSSDMGKCLTQINGRDAWAIGIQSLEKVDEGRTNRNDFKYIRIDGVAPTLENVAAGLYQNWAALTIQWNDNVLNATDVLLGQRFVDLAQGVADVASFNVSLQTDDTTTSNDDRPVGGFNTPEILDGGVAANVGSLAFAQGSVQPSVPFAAGNPVMPFNQGLVGPSTCAVPTFNADSLDVTQTN